jgi:cell filamentation protein
VSSDPLYCYPDTDVLRNELGIDDATELDKAERLLVRARVVEGSPLGDFDLSHLQAIHRHLFQDVYEWAGEIRQVEISKEGSAFQFRQYIGAGMADVHRRIEDANFLRGLDADEFAAKAGEIIGDVNYVHPFREGNGRTQFEYLGQLAEQAGHDFHPARLDPAQWIEASKAAHRGDYAPMAEAIRSALQPQRSREERDQEDAERARRERQRRDMDRGR